MPISPLTYGSVCSGIEAATAAWEGLGWRPAFFSEIEAFPRAVLQHHYPDVPLHGDFTTIEAGQYEPIRLLVGGTPCQSFSVAGLRGGLADDRGNLALEYLRLADRLRPEWLVWENVHGVLSSNGGRDFGSILGGLVELGYGFAYRVLDAQYFGVPQRRRRVFLVGYLGDWRPAAAVLFERHSLQGHNPPSRETGERAAAAARGSVAGFRETGRGWWTEGVAGLRADPGGMPENLIAAYGGNNTAGPINVATAVNAHGGPCGRLDFESETFVTAIAPTITSNPYDDHKSREGLLVAPTLRANTGRNQIDSTYLPVAHSLRAKSFDAGEDGTGRGTPLVPVCFSAKDSGGDAMSDLLAPDGGGRGQERNICAGAAVRRLTPRECERLQGFPDDYSLVPYRGKPASDGPRYRALGNSMAVPVMAWIGHRIESVRAILSPLSPRVR